MNELELTNIQALFSSVVLIGLLGLSKPPRPQKKRPNGARTHTYGKNT